MFSLFLFLCFKIEIHLTIRDGDVIQLKNIVSSAYLAIGPRKPDKAVNFDFFSTTSLDDGDTYWTISAVSDKSPGAKKIKCNSIITIQNHKYMEMIGNFLFMDRAVTRTIPLGDYTDLVVLWNLTCPTDANWKRGSTIQLKNIQNNCYLSVGVDAHINSRLPQRYQVGCLQHSARNTLWKAENGLFFEEKVYTS